MSWPPAMTTPTWRASSPAAYHEVLAVTAVADFNGQPGGGATATCRTDVDDTPADFSNFTRWQFRRGTHDRGAWRVHLVDLEGRRLQHDLRHQHGLAPRGRHGGTLHRHRTMRWDAGRGYWQANARRIGATSSLRLHRGRRSLLRLFGLRGRLLDRTEYCAGGCVSSRPPPHRVARHSTPHITSTDLVSHPEPCVSRLTNAGARRAFRDGSPYLSRSRIRSGRQVSCPRPSCRIPLGQTWSDPNGDRCASLFRPATTRRRNRRAGRAADWRRGRERTGLRRTGR